MNPYQSLQKDINEIRLLHLAPGKGTDSDEAITCTFTTAFLDNPPPYEALSYVWGKPALKQSVSVQGYRVPVTDNLHIALRYLQHEKTVRVLWIDALCINQNDLDERASQVAQMRYVFEKASSVVVFLGQEWNGSDLALEFFQQIANDETLHYSPLKEPHVVVQGHDSASEILRGHIIHFFDLDWWERVWTVQEFVLAKKVWFYLGMSMISGDTIIRSSRNLRLHFGDCCGLDDYFFCIGEGSTMCVWVAFHRLDHLARRRSNGARLGFLHILALFRMRQCFDPRDKIYGMLGLATGEWSEFVLPDYEMPPQVLFRTLVLDSINLTGKLDVFSHVYGVHNTELSLPSFVPDWSAKIEYLYHRAILFRQLRFEYYNASKDRKADVAYGLQGMLICKGLLHDIVSSVAAEKQDLENVTSLSDLKSWFALTQPETTDSIYSTQPDSWWSAMCGGLSVKQEKGRSWWVPADASQGKVRYETWKEWITLGRPEDYSSYAEVFDYDFSHHINSQFRRFAVTESGYIGFVPMEAKKGDVISVLLGGDVPFVLRPEPAAMGEEQRYRLIGDCYIDGIMMGECFEGLETEVVDVWLV